MPKRQTTANKVFLKNFSSGSFSLVTDCVRLKRGAMPLKGRTLRVFKKTNGLGICQGTFRRRFNNRTILVCKTGSYESFGLICFALMPHSVFPDASTRPDCVVLESPRFALHRTSTLWSLRVLSLARWENTICSSLLSNEREAGTYPCLPVRSLKDSQKPSQGDEP